MSYPSIHDAFQNLGGDTHAKVRDTSQQELVMPPGARKEKREEAEPDNGKYPSDASYSNYPIKVRCPKCRGVSLTRMSNEMGTAAWVWCVLLAPFACAGIACLCFESCRDKIHFCTRCGEVVGKKFAKVF